MAARGYTWLDPSVEAPWIEWEAAAEELLDATCTSSPVDAFALAPACGFEVRHRVGRAERKGNVIYVNVRSRPVRQQMNISHELGHFAHERAGLVDSEPGAKYIGGALLLPRRDFNRDLTRTAWSLPKLRELHRNVSATAIAVRTTQLRDAVATVIDPRGHKKPWRVWSPWIADRRLRRLSAFERELAERAYEERAEVRGDELCYAFPLVDGPPSEHRVVVVCEIEQLSLRI